MIDVQKIWSSAQLPTLPAVALRLIELSRTPDTEIREIVATIKSDPAIVARLLKAANSSFFGLSSKVTSIDQAVILLGTTAVTALALGFSLVDGSSAQGALGEAYAAFWLQSTVQATAARLLAKRQSAVGEEDLFLAGLLLDLGRLAMLKTIPREYQQVIAAASSMQRPQHEVETEILGVDHVEVGVELMKRWNLPDALGRAVRWHHEPLTAFAAGADAADNELLKTTAVASAVGEYFCGAAKGVALERMRALAQTFFQLSGPQLDDFLRELRNRIDEIGGLFSVDAQALATPSELLAQANEQLAMLAISAQAESACAHARQAAAETEIRQLEVKQRELKEQALRDPLTRAYNRHFFDETLTREIQRCTRHALPLGIIFFDADRFKQVNDSYGHAFGDEVLKRIAGVASAALRSTDVLARYGGEEFVILFGEPSEKGLEKTAERIRAGVESAEIFFEGRRVNVTVSVGAALTIPDRSGPAHGLYLVQAADEAMYEAKQAGRNLVCFRNLMSEFDRLLVPQALQNRFSRWLVIQGALDLAAVSRALLQCHTERVRLGELACQLGMLTPAHVEAIRDRQAQIGRRFGETAVRLELLDFDQLVRLLAVQHENPRELALTLARLRLLEASRIQSLLDAYEAEVGFCRLEVKPSPPAAIVSAT
jgi:diguanylate cyclase (GGDEF)-like protein